MPPTPAAAAASAAALLTPAEAAALAAVLRSSPAVPGVLCVAGVLRAARLLVDRRSRVPVVPAAVAGVCRPARLAGVCEPDHTREQSTRAAQCAVSVCCGMERGCNHLST